MRAFFRFVGEFFKKADMLLLTLCVATSVYGIVAISSATRFKGSTRYVLVQSAALLLGIIIYVLFTFIDVDVLAERRELLFIFSALFISMLFVWGDTQNGNRSWLAFKWLPFNMQPAEICKVFFILIIAKTMSIKQDKISNPLTLLQLAAITLVLFGLIMAASSDLGVALQYLLIFAVMAFVGGINLIWFLVVLGALIVASPFIFSHLRSDLQNRILMLFDPTIDSAAQGVRYQTNRSLRAIQNGGITGQGLYHGSMVQSGALPMQQNDFIFSAIGEELGMIGCLLALVLLTAIIVRCVRVGVKSGNYMNRLICVGIAGMLAVQIFINVGMCLGVFPVIGLTLPFLSYGGSSIVTMFLAMGIVSGIHMRPAPDSSARYIRPRYAVR